jgi:hypothetical protein
VPQKDMMYSFEEDSSLRLEEKNDKKFCYFVDVDGSYKGEYQLETIKFKFLINLTGQEVKQFYQEELQKIFFEGK